MSPKRRYKKALRAAESLFLTSKGTRDRYGSQYFHEIFDGKLQVQNNECGKAHDKLVAICIRCQLLMETFKLLSKDRITEADKFGYSLLTFLTSTWNGV